nr:MAG TPA: hypothetical protein [Caudoviricetes sp.]
MLLTVSLKGGYEVLFSDGRNFFAGLCLSLQSITLRVGLTHPFFPASCYP